MRRPLHWAMFMFLALSISSSQAQAPASNWVNVRDFGAKGDGKTDDSSSIVQAILHAENLGQGGGNVVYFPPAPGGGYLFDGRLPSLTNNIKIMLYLDSRLLLMGTLQPKKGYVIHGNSSGQIDAFSTDKLAGIAVGPRATPAVWIHNQAGVRLENLEVQYVNYGSDGIVIDGSSAKIDLNNVWVNMHGDATSGTPLLVKGGFGYTIEGGGYASPASSTSASIQFSDDGVCDYIGIFRVRHTFLGGHGIALSSGCAGMNSLSFEDLLYEAASGPFLTMNSNSSLGIWGVTIRDVNMADSQGDPKPPLIDAHHLGGGIRGVQVINSTTDGVQLTTGDPISDLEVWSADPRAGYKLSQSTGYVLHTPSAIYNAMPTYQLATTPDFTIVPSALTTLGVTLGQSASYGLNLTANAGFKQTVGLSCSGGPPGSTCAVSPSTASLNGPESSSVSATVTTVAPTKAVRLLLRGTRATIRNSWLLTSIAALGGLIFASFRFQKCRAQLPGTRSRTSFAAMLCAALWVSSCAQAAAGGGGSRGTTGNSPTPASTYTITVGGNCVTCSVELSHTTQLTLLVQ